MSKDIIVCGTNNCIDAFKTKEVNKVYVVKEKEKEFANYIRKDNISYVVVDKKYLDNITDNANHQGIALSISPIKYLSLEELINKASKKENPLILIFDELQDVNNFGAILRNVDAFGIDGIIINKKRNVLVTPTVAKISTGAVNHVDICRVTNLSDSIKKLKKEGYWVACLDMQGDIKLNQEKFDKPMAVVVGGEDKGITPVMKKNCDYSISIDMYGSVNSLNVSAATSILCYSKSLSL